MEEILNKLGQVETVIQRYHRGKLVQAELKRLRTILSLCDKMVISNEETLKSSMDHMSHRHKSQGGSSTHSPVVRQSSHMFKRGALNDFGGMIKATESVKQCMEYIRYTLQAALTVLTSGSTLEKMRFKPEGIKLAALVLNHRFRISRVMALLHLLNNDLLQGYLDSLDKVEAQNLLHLLQSLIVEQSIIDRFAFSTYEQIVNGIDSFHTVKKIKRILKEPEIKLMSRHVCNHRNVGLLLDSYFQQHTYVSLDLLMNALIINYELAPQVQEPLAKAFQAIFNLDQGLAEFAEINVQEFILFTDFNSLPEFFSLIENGIRVRGKTEDLLLKNLEMPHFSKYQLLKSKSKFSFEVQGESIQQRILTLQLIKMAGLRLSPNGCIVIFENAVDTQFMETLFNQFEDALVSPTKSSFFKGSASKFRKSATRLAEQSPRVQEEKVRWPQTMMSAFKQLQRAQHYSKHRMLELIDMEVREKELHAAMVVQVDSVTTYKPVTFPSMVRFNDEMFNEFENEIRQAQEAQLREGSLLSNIIQKLEKNNIQHEKLAALRKLQKHKEKKQIVSERIESETSNTNAVTSMQRPKLAILEPAQLSKSAAFEPMHSQHSPEKLQEVPGMGIMSMEFVRSNGSMGGEILSSDGAVEFEKATSQPAVKTNGAASEMRQPTLMMNVSRMVKKVVVQPEQLSQAVIALLQNESENQSKLITYLQQCKSGVLLGSERTESLLYLADSYFAKERNKLIKSMHYHDDQISEKEQSIRDLLGEIAEAEMHRNIVTEELEESTLKTIEVINIADIRIERENLEREMIELERRQAEGDKLETELIAQKEKFEEKRRKRRQGLANNPGATTVVQNSSGLK